MRFSWDLCEIFAATRIPNTEWWLLAWKPRGGNQWCRFHKHQWLVFLYESLWIIVHGAVYHTSLMVTETGYLLLHFFFLTPKSSSWIPTISPAGNFIRFHLSSPKSFSAVSRFLGTVTWREGSRPARRCAEPTVKHRRYSQKRGPSSGFSISKSGRLRISPTAQCLVLSLHPDFFETTSCATCVEPCAHYPNRASQTIPNLDTPSRSMFWSTPPLL